MYRLISSAALAFAASALQAQPLRIVQLDLARQMETPSFISNYIDRVSSFGYNAIELYLEGRVGTKTFSLPAGERYTPEEMKGVVAHAAGKGVTVIPVVSFLGHAEHFFKYPGLESICETRGDNFRLGRSHNAFCHSAPGAVRFFENYIADLCEIFSGPYFHAGFDEAWNSGICSLCAPKERRDELFAEEVLTIRRILKAHGKRMLMWDDFFGFHPKAFAQMPKDIVMMHWNYDCRISDRGDRFNFAGRFREDSLAKYAALGFDAIPCAWFKPDNIRSFILYARRNKTFGYLQTNWEDLIPNFHGGSLPGVLAASLMLDDPAGAQADDAFPRAVKRLFPSLAPAEVAATVRALENPSDALALEILESSALARGLGEVSADPFAEKALFDDILCRTRLAVLRSRLAKAGDILSDPRRTAEDVAAAKRLVADIPARARALAARREAQFELWRKGCTPKHVADGPREAARRAEEILAEAAVAAPDERRLALELTLVDYYGIPNWTVEGRFADGWRKLGAGAWKPRDDAAVFTEFVTFRAEAMPTELRISEQGYGTAQLRYVSVEDRASRVVPKAVLASEGRVQNPAAVLVDDYAAATFGRPGYLVQFYDEAEATAKSVLTLSLAPGR